MARLPYISGLAGCSIILAVIVGVTPATAGCNSGNVADDSLLTSGACQATAKGQGTLAVGSQAFVNQPYGTALGVNAYAAENSVSIGAGAGDFQRDPASAIAIGYTAGSRGGNESIAVGQYSQAQADSSIAIGSGSNNVPGAVSRGYRSIAIGQQSSAGDYQTSGYGLGHFGTSVGFNTHTGFAATAVGTDATAAGDGAAAFGRFAKASAPSSVALGEDARALKPRSVALGSGSVANTANTISVGSNTARRRIVNVAPAVHGSDAATLAQVKNIAAAAIETALLNVNDNGDIRRELAELRGTVRQQQELLARQQQELAELKAGKTVAALAD